MQYQEAEEAPMLGSTEALPEDPHVKRRTGCRRAAPLLASGVLLLAVGLAASRFATASVWTSDLTKALGLDEVTCSTSWDAIAQATLDTTFAYQALKRDGFTSYTPVAEITMAMSSDLEETIATYAEEQEKKEKALKRREIVAIVPRIGEAAALFMVVMEPKATVTIEDALGELYTEVMGQMEEYVAQEQLEASLAGARATMAAVVQNLKDYPQYMGPPCGNMTEQMRNSRIDFWKNMAADLNNNMASVFNVQCVNNFLPAQPPNDECIRFAQSGSLSAQIPYALLHVSTYIMLGFLAAPIDPETAQQSRKNAVRKREQYGMLLNATFSNWVDLNKLPRCISDDWAWEAQTTRSVGCASLDQAASCHRQTDALPKETGDHALPERAFAATMWLPQDKLRNPYTNENIPAAMSCDISCTFSPATDGNLVSMQRRAGQPVWGETGADGTLSMKVAYGCKMGPELQDGKFRVTPAKCPAVCKHEHFEGYHAKWSNDMRRAWLPSIRSFSHHFASKKSGDAAAAKACAAGAALEKEQQRSAGFDSNLVDCRSACLSNIACSAIKFTNTSKATGTCSMILDYAPPAQEVSATLLAKDMYCSNRGGIGGSNEYSKNMGANSLAACIKYVSSVPGCGTWFDYGMNDGWCDCVPGSETCNQAGAATYGVYQLQATTTATQACSSMRLSDNSPDSDTSAGDCQNDKASLADCQVYCATLSTCKGFWYYDTGRCCPKAGWGSTFNRKIAGGSFYSYSCEATATSNVQWTEAWSVDGPVSLGPASSKEGCYAMCANAQAANPGKTACAYQCNGCYLGASLAQRSAASNQACFQYGATIQAATEAKEPTTTQEPTTAIEGAMDACFHLLPNDPVALPLVPVPVPDILPLQPVPQQLPGHQQPLPGPPKGCVVRLGNRGLPQYYKEYDCTSPKCVMDVGTAGDQAGTWVWDVYSENSSSNTKWCKSIMLVDDDKKGSDQCQEDSGDNFRMNTKKNDMVYGTLNVDMSSDACRLVIQTNFP